MAILPWQLFINGVVAGSVYALVALSFGLIYASARFFHFAHGAAYTTSAYLVYLFMVQLALPLPVALISSLLFTCTLGALMELIVFRPLRTKKASDMALLLASLGLYVLIQNVISLLFGDDTKSIRRGAIKGGIQIIGATITSVQVKIILTSLILSCLVAIALRRTRLGRSVRAVANDPELASIMGIESDRVILFVFVLGSGLAGFGAILASLDTDITPTMGFRALLMGVIALFAGGAGSPLGAIVGGFLLGVTQHLCVWKLPTHWQDAIVFGILVLFLLFKPEGFLGGDSGKVGG